VCGRFVSTSPPAALAGAFGAELSEEVASRPEPPRWNVAPTARIYAVVGSPRRLEARRWGLVPSWAKDPSVGRRHVNARAEGLADRPAYRSALARRRCLIPADGFYEWSRPPAEAGSQRRPPAQPFFFGPRDGSGPLALAGLWEAWRDGEGSVLLTATIVTTAANRVVGQVHDRMPAILGPEAWSAWLDTDTVGPSDARALLGPAPDELLVAWPVGPAVNSPRNEGPGLLEPAGP